MGALVVAIPSVLAVTLTNTDSSEGTQDNEKPIEEAKA